jgi:hypothetical protein
MNKETPESRLTTDNIAHLLSHVDNDHFSYNKGAQNVNGVRYSGGMNSKTTLFFGHQHHLAIGGGEVQKQIIHYIFCQTETLIYNFKLLIFISLLHYQVLPIVQTSTGPVLVR